MVWASAWSAPGSRWNNPGTLLVELGKADEAVAALRRALAADPDDARAHDELTDAGRIGEAAAHWLAYLEHDGDSEWATYATRQLG
jgi:tetratricopeptide (TPR) repeat protein